MTLDVFFALTAQGLIYSSGALLLLLCSFALPHLLCLGPRRDSLR